MVKCTKSTKNSKGREGFNLSLPLEALSFLPSGNHHTLAVTTTPWPPSQDTDLEYLLSYWTSGGSNLRKEQAPLGAGVSLTETQGS
jgi:hypothetical protein